jgi:hypothetical protein
MVVVLPLSLLRYYFSQQAPHHHFVCSLGGVAGAGVNIPGQPNPPSDFFTTRAECTDLSDLGSVGLSGERQILAFLAAAGVSGPCLYNLAELGPAGLEATGGWFGSGFSFVVGCFC